MSAIASARSATTLSVIAQLLDRLHEEPVVYCHWKSTEHLAASLAGRTDLDVLVDRDAAVVLPGLLAGAGFRRLTSVPRRAYPGIEDWFALDPESGRLVHLHLHYRITLGEKHLKGYHLPWERRILASRRLDDSGEIWVVDPHIELTLLLVRAALKLRNRDRLAALASRPALSDDVGRELRWLAARVDLARLSEVATELVGRRAAGLVVAACEAPLSHAQLRRLRRWVVPPLGDHRTYGALEATARRWLREWHFQTTRVVRRVFGGRRIFPTPRIRVLPHGGVMIAFIGTDGSGKSTVVSETTRWLSSKVDVLPIYLGSGKGPRSLVRRLLRGAARLARPLRRGRPGRDVVHPGQDVVDEPSNATSPRWLARAAFFALWALSIARERRARLRRARRARDLGMIVLSDRFPQSQQAGFNDGPLLSRWRDHPSWWLRTASRAEASVFALAESSPPDLVVRLRVDVDTAARRRPTNSTAWIGRKVEAVGALRFPPGTRVVDVDATQPLAQVLLEVKRAVWEVL